MKILEINIIGFGTHNNLTLTLSENVNVILGDNESGKSTIGTFIYTMLYGFGSNSNEKRAFYRPWNDEIDYGGNILLECAGTVYKIDAQFGNTPEEDSVSLYNISMDEKIEIPSNKSVGEILLGVSEEAFSISSFLINSPDKVAVDNSDNENMFDYLMKKNIEKKQASDEMIVLKRIDSSIDFIGSLEEDTGKLGKLKEKKGDAEYSLSKIKKSKKDLLDKKAELQKLENELSDIKNNRLAEKNDTIAVANAIEVVSLHSEIKVFVSEINKYDDELAQAVLKSKKIRKPIDIIYITMMVLCFLSFVVIFFSKNLASISFFTSIAGKLISVSKLSTYITIFVIAVFVTIWNMILTNIFNKPVRNLSDHLTEKEIELFDLMDVEYIPGSKNRQYNRDNINVALEKHKKEYRIARSILENEDNKEKETDLKNTLIKEQTEKIEEIKNSISILEEKVSKMCVEDEIQYTIDEITEEINKYSQMKKSLLISREVMKKAIKKWQEESVPSYVEEAGKILNVLTDGKYDNLQLSRNLEISLESNNSNIYSSASYGGATVDQMYLALRLSLIKVLSSPENMLPIVLDDSFVQYDSKRKKIAYEYINSYSSENSVQFIMTMCSKDELPEDFNIIKL